MNQVYSGNYQTSYQSTYQTPYYNQWSPQSYDQGSYNDYYGKKSFFDSPNRNKYSAPCMGQCNPSKLYADTFSYLEQNLMKPVIEEVYQDLKSITAANTIPNNPAATKMGLAGQRPPAVRKIKPQNVQGQNQIGANAVPLAPSLYGGQLLNDSAIRPVNNMPQRPTASPRGARHHSNIRNGLQE